MPNWAEDHELAYGAQELANVMLTMLSGAGISVNIPGYPNQEDVDVFRESIWRDAEDYMSMNPGSLEEEYNEVMRAAAHLVGDSPSRAYLQTANAILAEGPAGLIGQRLDGEE